MSVVGGATKTYGFDSLIISGSYGGHRQHTTDNARGMPKAPTPGELKRSELDVTIKPV